MERIAVDSSRDYRPILDTLCAYALEHAGMAQTSREAGIEKIASRDSGGGGLETYEEFQSRQKALSKRCRDIKKWTDDLREAAKKREISQIERPDVRATLDVIGRRRADPAPGGSVADGEPPRLERPEGRSVALVAIPEAQVNALVDAIAIWRDAQAWRPDLKSLNLQGAQRAQTTLRRVDLTEAKMDGAVLDEARLEGTIMYMARAQGAILKNAFLTGVDARGAHFYAADLKGACLAGARLDGSVLQHADLEKAFLEGADLRYAHLEGANLRRAHMEGTNLSDAHLGGSFLWGACLERAVLRRTRLPAAHLQYANFKHTDLSHASFRGADLEGTCFDGALLRGADLRDAENLTYNQLTSAFGDQETKLPEALDEQRPRLLWEAGWFSYTLDANIYEEWQLWREERASAITGADR